jgi:hypothetical protein
MAVSKRRIKGLHVYVGDEYKVTRSMLRTIDDELSAINSFIIQIGHPDSADVRFDYQNRSNASQVVSRSIRYLEDFLDVWYGSALDHRDIYLSLPALHNNISTYQNATYFYSYYVDYMKKAKEAVIKIAGTDFWNENVVGFFFRTEAIYPIQEKLNASNPTSTPMVQLLNDIAYRIRQDYEIRFIWCPYYGYGTYRENIAYNIGVIANRTNIFDVICIQPATYYHSAPSQNIDLVYESASENEVVGIDELPVAGGKKSSATAMVGVNMEADNNFNNSKSTIFNQYVNTFKPLVDEVPIVFYANTLEVLTGNSELIKAIKKFYG